MSSPRVYSYIRFSSAEQAQGDSERRQDDRARAYAEREGMPFDESLRMTDRGRTAFKAHHKKKGVLGIFLKSVEAGDVPQGSVLFVENIDRLTRENMFDAIETILFGILKHQIAIATPDATYTPEALSNGMIYRLIGEIDRAHRESLRKSDLAKANWKQKRKSARDGVKLTARVPSWIDVVRDGKILSPEEKRSGAARHGGNISFALNPEAAPVIRLMFEMKRDGIGSNSIAKKLNEDGAWCPSPNGWITSYVKKIVSSRTTVGELQPCNTVNGKPTPIGEPIENYYPPVVDRELFNIAQQRLNDNQGKGGRTGKAHNIFSHIVKCAYCGGAMHYENKGADARSFEYLYCDRGRRKAGCGNYRIRYDHVESLILENCVELDPSRVLPSDDEKETACQELKLRIDGLTATLADTERRIGNLLSQLETEDNPTIRDHAAKRIPALEDEKASTEKELEIAQKKLANAEHDRKSLASWSKDLATLQTKLATDDVSLRLRMRSHLREFIAKIEIFAHGLPEAEFFPITNRVEPIQKMLDAVEMDKVDPRWPAFVNDLVRRSHTREGRFVRIIFKTGKSIDVVPEGSLAIGHAIDWQEGGREHVTPKISRLWKRYCGIHSRKAALAEQRKQKQRSAKKVEKWQHRNEPKISKPLKKRGKL